MANLSIYAARHPMYLHLYLLKIGLGYITSMHMLTTIEEWELQEKFGDLAPMAHILLSLFSWDGSLPLQIVDIDCLFRGDSTDGAHLNGLLLFWAMLPVIWPLFLFVMFFALFEIVGFFKVVVGNQDQSTEAILGQNEPRPASPESPKPLAIKDGPSQLNAIVPLPDPGKEPEEPPSPVRITGSKRFSFKPRKSSKNSSDLQQEVLKMAAQRSRTDASQKNLQSLLHEARIFGIWRRSALELEFGHRLSIFAEDSMTIMFVALILVYPCVIKHLVQFLRCDILEGDDPNATTRLLLAPEVVCWSDKHFSLLVPCMTFIVIWGFGIPLVCFFFPWQHRNHLAEVRAKCRYGFLTNGYETKFYYWELVNLVRRLCLLLVPIAPSASRTYQLAVWTTLGLLFAALHSLLEPYDNRGGLLLDSLECQHHLLFFGCIGCLLFIFSMDFASTMNFFFLLIGMVLNVMFIVRLGTNYLAQMRRQVSDEWVEVQRIRQRTQRLNIGSHNPRKVKQGKGLFNFIKTRIFLMEVEMQAGNAQVQFSNRSHDLIVYPGKSDNGTKQKDVQEFERLFISQGLADGLHHAVVDSNFERLPCLFLEYIIRQTFVWQADKNRSRLEAMRELKNSGIAPNLVVAEERRLSGLAPMQPATKRLSAFGMGTKKRSKESTTEDESSEPEKPVKPQLSGAFAMALPSKVKKLRDRAQFAAFFNDKSFAIGMSTNDFQAEMSRITEKSKKKIEEDFHGFMLRKGVIKEGDNLSPRARMLSKITTLRKNSKDQSSVNSLALTEFMQVAKPKGGDTDQSQDENVDYQPSAPMEVEDLDHPGDALMLKMTPKAQTPPEGGGQGLGDTILPSAVPNNPVATSLPQTLGPPVVRAPGSASPRPPMPPPPGPPPGSTG